MLALLRPWQCLDEIKSQDESFGTAFLTFDETTSESARNVMAGVQYYYECKNATYATNEGGREPMTTEIEGVSNDVDDSEEWSVPDKRSSEENSTNGNTRSFE